MIATISTTPKGIITENGIMWDVCRDCGYWHVVDFFRRCKYCAKTRSAREAQKVEEYEEERQIMERVRTKEKTEQNRHEQKCRLEADRLLKQAKTAKTVR